MDLVHGSLNNTGSDAAQQQQQQVMATNKLTPPSAKLPHLLNSQWHYQQCIERLTDIQKFTHFMEEDLIIKCNNLSDKELWEVIQKVTTDVITTHPVTIQKEEINTWVENMDQALNVQTCHTFCKDRMVKQSTVDFQSSSNSSSSKTSSDSDFSW